MKSRLSVVFAVTATLLSLAVFAAGTETTKPEVEIDVASAKYVLCIGELEESCPKKFGHRAFRYCPADGTNDQMNADWLCKRSGTGWDGARAVRLGNVAGNRCGYTTLEVTCFDRGRMDKDGRVRELD